MRLRDRQDGGFTLTELLVVMTLTGIVGGMVVAAATTGLDNQRKVQDRNDALAEMRTALQRIERDVRSTSQVELAENNVLELQETQTSATTYVTYCVVVDGTTYDLTKYAAAVPSCSSSTVTPTTLLRNVVNPTTSPVFSYAPVTGYTAPSGAISVSTVNCAMTPSTPTTYDPGCIGTVTLQFDDQPSSIAQPIDLTDNGTDLRNAP